MSWQLLGASGIAFNIETSDDVSYASSRFSSSGGSRNQWRVSRADAQTATYRVAAISYTGDAPGDYPSQISDVTTTITNEGGPSSWQPSPMQFNDAAAIQYDSGAEESSVFTFQVEVWVQQAVLTSQMIVQQRSYQAIRGSDVACQCWLRDETGPVDASAMPLQVEAIAYGRSHVQATWLATGQPCGRVDFTVPEGHKLAAGLYQVRIRSADHGPVVSLGLLEVV